MRQKKTLAYLLAVFACAAPAGAMTTGAPPPAEAIEQGVSTERAPAARPASAERKKDAVHGHEHGRADKREGNRKLSTGKKDE